MLAPALPLALHSGCCSLALSLWCPTACVLIHTVPGQLPSRPSVTSASYSVTLQLFLCKIKGQVTLKVYCSELSRLPLCAVWQPARCLSVLGYRVLPAACAVLPGRSGWHLGPARRLAGHIITFYRLSFLFPDFDAMFGKSFLCPPHAPHTPAVPSALARDRERLGQRPEASGQAGARPAWCAAGLVWAK